MEQKNLTMRDWPEAEKPYEKLSAMGPSYLTDAELIAILLSSGTQGRTSVELAKQLMIRFEGLAVMADASPEELQTVSGVGKVKSYRVLAALELGRRLNAIRGSDLTPVLNHPAKVEAYLAPLLRHSDYEQFVVVLLDVRQRVIRRRLISTGGLTATIVRPRDVFRDALRANANGIILAHNHPSGDPEPSTADITMTEKIIALGEEIGINVLDHIVIAAKGYVSFRERGLIQ